jgi:hypothetical protein
MTCYSVINREKSNMPTPTWEQVLHKLRTQPTVSVPEAGFAVGDLAKNASYEGAKNGTLGVPVIDSGGKKRVPSIAVLRVLGLDQGSTPVPIVKSGRVRTRKAAAVEASV